MLLPQNCREGWVNYNSLIVLEFKVTKPLGHVKAQPCVVVVVAQGTLWPAPRRRRTHAQVVNTCKRPVSHPVARCTG